MADIVSHVVRRGLSHLAAPPTGPWEQDIEQPQAESQVYEKNPNGEVKAWQIGMIVATCIVFLIASVAVKYTIQQLISTLVMIEQPQTFVLSETKVAQSSDPDAPLEKDALLDEEVTIIKEQPITSSIRRTIRHLHSIGGFWGRWRGARVFVIYCALHGLTANLLNMAFLSISPGASPITRILASTIASVLLARIRMTWTHIKISQPSTLPWYRRIPRGSVYFKALALPTLVFAASQQAAIILPTSVFFLWHPHPGMLNHGDAIRIVSTIITFLFVVIAIVIPASVTLTRVEASLLPEDQETIVSFDRTLGGAVTSAVSLDVKTTVKARFVAAWKSFDRPSRMRVIKYCMKMAAIEVAFLLAFAGVLGIQIYFIGLDKITAFAQSGIVSIQMAQMTAN